MNSPRSYLLWPQLRSSRSHFRSWKWVMNCASMNTPKHLDPRTEMKWHDDWCFILWLHPSLKHLGRLMRYSHHCLINIPKIHPKSSKIHPKSSNISHNPFFPLAIPWESPRRFQAAVATGKPPQDGVPVEVAKADRTTRLLRHHCDKGKKWLGVSQPKNMGISWYICWEIHKIN